MEKQPVPSVSEVLRQKIAVSLEMYDPNATPKNRFDPEATIGQLGHIFETEEPSFKFQEEKPAIKTARTLLFRS